MSERCGMTLKKVTQGTKEGKATAALEFTARVDATLMNGLPTEICQMYARMLEADLVGQWSTAEGVYVPGFGVFTKEEGAAVLEPAGGASLENVRLARKEEKGERVTRLSFVVRLEGDEAREAAKWAARHGCKGVELSLKSDKASEGQSGGGERGSHLPH